MQQAFQHTSSNVLGDKTRKEFTDVNIVTVNLFSITIKPPSSRIIKVWDKIEENHFGSPNEKTNTGNAKKVYAPNGVLITTYFKP